MENSFSSLCITEHLPQHPFRFILLHQCSSSRIPRRTLADCLPLLVITSGRGHLIKCSPDIISESFQSENDQRCRLNGVRVLPTSPVLVICFMEEPFSYNENIYGRKWRFVTTVTFTRRRFLNSYCRLSGSVIRKIEKAIGNIAIFNGNGCEMFAKRRSLR